MHLHGEGINSSGTIRNHKNMRNLLISSTKEHMIENCVYPPRPGRERERERERETERMKKKKKL